MGMGRDDLTRLMLMPVVFVVVVSVVVPDFLMEMRVLMMFLEKQHACAYHGRGGNG